MYSLKGSKKLSNSILEMKFMKRSKEKAQRDQEAVEGEAMFSDNITKDMRQGMYKYVIEPSYVPCENLIVGRMSFHGMNPEIERLMESEETKPVRKQAEEADVSEQEMAKRYNVLVGTMGNKFSTKKESRTKMEIDIE
ncbi:M-phase phosphoprotein 6 [Blattella germanica]|nr:M-phase phosphoprotein 6 [Blattella germanica]